LRGGRAPKQSNGDLNVYNVNIEFTDNVAVKKHCAYYGSKYGNCV